MTTTAVMVTILGLFQWRKQSDGDAKALTWIQNGAARVSHPPFDDLPAIGMHSTSSWAILPYTISFPQFKKENMKSKSI